MGDRSRPGELRALLERDKHDFFFGAVVNMVWIWIWILRGLDIFALDL